MGRCGDFRDVQATEGRDGIVQGVAFDRAQGSRAR
jgi:hypothetical protein